MVVVWASLIFCLGGGSLVGGLSVAFVAIFSSKNEDKETTFLFSPRVGGRLVAPTPMGMQFDIGGVGVPPPPSSVLILPSLSLRTLGVTCMHWVSGGMVAPSPLRILNLVRGKGVTLPPFSGAI